MPNPNKLPPKFKKLKKSIYDKQRRDSNIEHEKERHRQKYLKNRDRVLEQQHERYLKMKEAKKVYNRQYHKNLKTTTP